MRYRPLPQLSEADIARFWSHVEKTEGCWYWRNARAKQTYGVFGVGGTYYRAHRIACQLAGTLTPEAPNAIHKCNMRSCVRPDPEHVRGGTQQQNMYDRTDSGSFRRAAARKVAAELATVSPSEAAEICTKWMDGETTIERLKASYPLLSWRALYLVLGLPMTGTRPTKP